VKQGELIGVLHLENKLASHVFTPSRISVLELLSSQAAVALENARLYSDLRMSEERWRNLFENVPVGVALIGSHGRYVETNPALRRMTGYSEAELRHLSPVNITHEDDRAATESIIAASTAGQPGAQRYEKRFRRKDGGVIWAEVSAFLVPVVGSTPLLARVAVDITDRRRAEDELRHSEAYLAEAQRLSQTGSFGWDVLSGDIFWSEETFKIFGYDKAPSATLDMVLQRVHPDDLAFVQRAIDRVTRDGDEIDCAHRLLLPDGSVKYVHAVGHTVKNAAGSIECVGAVTDVTAATEADNKLRRAQADLARVTRVTTLGEVTTSIVHEIVQPLSAAVTNGNTCLYWLDDKHLDLAKARPAAERTVRDAERTTEIIGRIRALMIRSPPQKREMDMNSVVSAILALTHDEFIKRHILVSTELAEALPPVLGDRVQLQQLMLNLIMNGIEAMASVTGRPKALIITTRAEGPGRVLTLVRDSGTGLDSETADEIFKPFVTTKPEGTGMGLAICRSIVEAHAGRIWASPGPRQGAVFQFALPTAH
jgi:PAS domain S-box-containing protein